MNWRLALLLVSMLLIVSGLIVTGSPRGEVDKAYPAVVTQVTAAVSFI
jgi:hypothetical protein